MNEKISHLKQFKVPYKDGVNSADLISLKKSKPWLRLYHQSDCHATMMEAEVALHTPARFVLFRWEFSPPATFLISSRSISTRKDNKCMFLPGWSYLSHYLGLTAMNVTWPLISVEPLSYQVQGGPTFTVGIKVALCN